MNDGSGVANLPEIDDRTGAQMDDTGFHPAMQSFAYRARLDRTNGQHDTEVLRLARPGVTGFPTQFNLMRQWLDNLAADTSSDPQGVRVRRAKPAGLQDGCYTTAGFQADDFTCGGTWQYYGTPRQVAGGPLSDDVMKCRLKPLVRSEYAPITFTDEQWATLQATFPTGVCDYSTPGVSQQGPKATWLTFANGPGGEPLGAPPAAQAAAVPVATLLEDQIAFLDQVGGGSFAEQLAEVGAALARGGTRVACNKVGAYVNHVAAQAGKQLAEADAAALTAGASRIAAAVGC
jgi:hypothetical protein